MLTIARSFLLARSMGIFTYLLSLPLQDWHKAGSALVLIAFGSGYYAIMTLYFNSHFVDELERLLPDKMSKVLSRIRVIIHPSYA